MKDGNRFSVSSETDILTNGSSEEMKNEQDSDKSGSMEEQMQILVNQKNYLEERNRYGI